MPITIEWFSGLPSGLLFLVLLALPAQARTQPLRPLECLQIEMDEETRKKVYDILLDALDQALKDHVVNLFAVLIKEDDTPARQRAIRGTQRNITAYVRERARISKWWHECR